MVQGGDLSPTGEDVDAGEASSRRHQELVLSPLRGRAAQACRAPVLEAHGDRPARINRGTTEMMGGGTQVARHWPLRGALLVGVLAAAAAGGCTAWVGKPQVSGVEPWFISLVAGPSGEIFAAYYDRRSREIRVPVRRAGGWSRSTVARADSTFLQAATGPDGVLEGVFNDEGEVYSFRQVPTGWAIENIGSFQIPGGTGAVVSVPGGDPLLLVPNTSRLTDQNLATTAVYSRSPSGWDVSPTPVTFSPTSTAVADASGHLRILNLEGSEAAYYVQGDGGWSRSALQEAPAAITQGSGIHLVMDDSGVVRACIGPVYGINEGLGWSWEVLDTYGFCKGLGVHPDGRAYVLMDSGLFEEDDLGRFENTYDWWSGGWRMNRVVLSTEGPFRIHELSEEVGWNNFAQQSVEHYFLVDKVWERGGRWEEFVDD